MAISTLAQASGLSCGGTYNFSGSIVQCMVATGGTYEIYARGAAGGGDSYGNSGGQGAFIDVDLDLDAGTEVDLLVGQHGGTGVVVSYFNGGGGGGGGTFLALDDGVTKTPLVVAGGGGGAEQANGINASTGTSGLTAVSVIPGGVNGNGGEDGGAIGGGGFYTDSYGSGYNESSSFLNGGEPGSAYLAGGGRGGFGGGGDGVGGPTNGGGGGGYSGGAGGDDAVGGGGGSYYAPGSSLILDGNAIDPSTGDGLVTFTLLAAATPEPASLVLFAVGAGLLIYCRRTISGAA